MIKEGALENPKPEVIFGLHVVSGIHSGKIAYRAGATLAGSDTFRITVRGRQTHGARPWAGVDPIVIGAQIILALQTIQSRQVDVTRNPSVLTVAIFNSGNRSNIIPDKAEMEGTLRTYDLEMRDFIMRRVKETAEAVARSGGGDAEVQWISDGYIPTVNNVSLTKRMVPTLQRVAGADNVLETAPRTAADDFSFFAQQIPGLFFFVGITPPKPNVLEITAAPNHSPRFFVDESGLLTGLRATLHVAFDYLRNATK
jgi:amidohydrolase